MHSSRQPGPQRLSIFIGSWVTYRFRGTHASGLPRFASFVRVREDAPTQ